MTSLRDIPTTKAKVTHRVLIGHCGDGNFLVLGIGSCSLDAIRDAAREVFDAEAVNQLELAGCTREVASYLKIHAKSGAYAKRTGAPLPEGLVHLITAS